jgi:chromate transporter
VKVLWEIFITFINVGALTFGGGYAMMPLLQKYVVAKRQWATSEEVMDYYAIAQCLPGIIMVNTAMLIGYKRKGWPGMAAAAFGVMLPSVIVIFAIALSIEQFMEYSWLRHAFNGIRAAVLALIADAVIKMWKSGVKDKFGIILFAAALGLLTFVGLSPVLPLVAGAVCGIVIKNEKAIRLFINGKKP